jgi:hypothetical protein
LSEPKLVEASGCVLLGRFADIVCQRGTRKEREKERGTEDGEPSHARRPLQAAHQGSRLGEDSILPIKMIASVSGCRASVRLLLN